MYALLKRIIEMFYQLYVIDIVDIVTFNQTLESVCDRKLRETVISQQLMTKLLDTLLVKEPLLLSTVVKFLKLSNELTVIRHSHVIIVLLSIALNHI